MGPRIIKHASPLLLKRGMRGIVAGEAADIVVHYPTAPALSAAAFELDSTFPEATLVTSLHAFVRAAEDRPDTRLMLFAHATDKASADDNKALADLRAQLVLALLTADLALLDKVAKNADWSLVHYQAAMKALGIAPMPVDGKPGPKTNRGLKRFQSSYNAGDYHKRTERKRAYGELKCDGVMGPKTEAAIRDAYLALVPASLDKTRFFGPKFAGCGHFNRTGDEKRDRRVCLTFYRPDFPTESKIPCKQGDAGSCTVNQQTEHPLKCNFYRRTIEAETPVDGAALPGFVQVRLRLIDPFGEIIASKTGVLRIGKDERAVTTDGEGHLDLLLPEQCNDAVVDIEGCQFPLAVADMTGHDTSSGAAVRLKNLGYASGDADNIAGDRKALVFGLQKFVHDHQIDPQSSDYKSLLDELLKAYGV